LNQPFLQCGNSGSGGEPLRRRKPALHLWRRNEKDVPDPRFSLFGFSSRRNSCSGRAFALHPFTLQNERRIDHGDFFPSSRLRVPEGAHLALTSRRCPDVWPALLCAAMLLLFPGSVLLYDAVSHPQTADFSPGPGWLDFRCVLAAADVFPGA